MKLLTALFVIVLFAGCIQNPTSEERLKCIELASYAFAQIPECSTQEKCFELVDKSFQLNGKVFSSSTSQSLFDAKNRLARAWLFINGARSNLSNIKKSCEQSTYSTVPREVNNFSENLLNATSELDEFNKSAISAINFELDDLELQDLNSLIREEIFTGYILLNQNIVDFSEKNPARTSYASRFIEAHSALSKIAVTLDKSARVEEQSLFSIISQNKGYIENTLLANSALKRDFSFPIILPIAETLNSFLADFMAIEGSVKLLEKSPSFEVLLVLEKTAGNGNSAAGEFFSLFILLEQSRTQLIAKDAQINRDISDAISRTEALAESFPQNYPSFEIYDKNFSIISVPDIDEYRNPKNYFLKQGAELKSRLFYLAEYARSNGLSFGSKFSQLDAIHADSLQLFERATKMQSSLEKSLFMCLSEVNEIEQELTSLKQLNPAAQSVASRLMYSISSLENVQTHDKCSEVIALYNDFMQINSASSPAKAAEQKAMECIENYRAEFFHSPDFNGRITSLETMLKSGVSPYSVYTACEDAKALALDELAADPRVSELTSDYVRLENSLSLLLEFAQKYNLPRESYEKLREKNSEISAHFEGGKFLPAHFGEISQIRLSVSKLEQDISETFPKILSSAFEKHAEIVPYRATTLDDQLGVKDSMRKISFEGISKRINTPFRAQLALDSNNAGVVFSMPHISFEGKGDVGEFYFSALMAGENSLVIDLSSSKARDSDKIASAQLSAAKGRMLEEKKSLLEKAFSLLGKLDDKTAFLRDKFDFYSAQDDFNSASGELFSLRDHVLSLEAQSFDINAQKKNALEITSNAGRAQVLLREISSNLSRLKGEKDSLTAEQLESVYAYFPLTETRIADIELVASRTIPFEKITMLFEAKDYTGVLSIAQANSLEDLLQKAEFFHSETFDAIEKIEASAQQEYQIASESELHGKEDEILLAKAQQAIANKQYMLSIYYSLQLGKESVPSTSLFVLPPFSEWNVMMGLFVVMAAGLAFLKLRPEKKCLPSETIKLKKADSEHEN